MAEYIEREAVLDAVFELPPKMDEQGYGWVARGGLYQTIRDFPAADVVPVVHGEWVKNEGRQGWNCSVCKTDDLWAFDDCIGEKEQQDLYCPNCGARMDGGV